MNTEAAHCFRRACEASDPLDQTIFIGLRQAWLALALQVEQRATQRPRLIVPTASNPEPADRPQAVASRAKGRRKASPTRRRKLAA
jgi:hypothetical protein